jgi:cell pole-organizing protein PopZ
MAEVEPKTGAEPSMEEILASIRKIISDEQPAASNGSANDVVELTQAVQTDGSVVDVKAEPPPPPPAAEPHPEPAMPKTPESLISEKAVSASASALSSLANTVEIERLASEPPQGTTYMGNGARTLEDMVIELMRPLLKQWLDANLPATVDRLVQKEIERISKKAKD